MITSKNITADQDLRLQLDLSRDISLVQRLIRRGGVLPGSQGSPPLDDDARHEVLQALGLASYRRVPGRDHNGKLRTPAE